MPRLGIIDCCHIPAMLDQATKAIGVHHIRMHHDSIAVSNRISYCVVKEFQVHLTQI